MAGNMIMMFGSWIFAVLFAFLLFIFTTAVISLFRKSHYPDYEPSVSVIVPCYNEERSIKECLNAIYALDYPKEKLEVMVVDDGSTDNTLAVLGELKKKHEGMAILKGNHEGKSPSLNLGVKRASNEVILAVDADTVLEKGCLRKLARPFADKSIGLTNGSCVAKDNSSIMGLFQKIEYHHNNLLRRSFSLLFRNGIWFFGAFVCYRKKALEKIGYFKTDTMTEDMDTAMEIYAAGYRAINVHDAIGHTAVPSNISDFFTQRTRWFMGGLQTLSKNRALFSRKSSISILFLFINQYWWAFFAVVFFPLIAYQIYYWLPHTGSIYPVLGYLFRWFSLAGPVYVLYKIPEWGISFYNIFGVLSGVISVFLITKAIYMFRDRLHIRNMFGIFFYFPYTILLNGIAVASLVKLLFLKKKHFIY